MKTAHRSKRAARENMQSSAIDFFPCRFDQAKGLASRAVNSSEKRGRRYLRRSSRCSSLGGYLSEPLSCPAPSGLGWAKQVSSIGQPGEPRTAKAPDDLLLAQEQRNDWRSQTQYAKARITKLVMSPIKSRLPRPPCLCATFVADLVKVRDQTLTAGNALLVRSFTRY